MKKSALLACTMLSVFAAGYASAYDPRTQRDMQPTIEINLDALHNLNNNQGSVLAQPQGNGQQQDYMPFAEQSKADKKKAAKHKAKKKKNKKKIAKKAPIKHVQQTQVAPEVKVVADHDKQTDDIPVLVQIPEHDKFPSVQAPSAAPNVKTPGIEALPVQKKPEAMNLDLPKPQKKFEPVTPSLPEPSLPPVSQNTTKKPASLPVVPVPAPATHSDLPALPSQPAVPSVLPSPQPAVPPALPAVATPPSGVLPVMPDKKSDLDIKDLEPVKKAEPPAVLITPPSPAPSPSAVMPPLPSLPGAPDMKEKPVSALPPMPDVVKPAVLPQAPAVAKTLDNATPAKKAAADTSASSGGAPDVRIVFNENETDIPSGSTAKLDVVAQQLTKNPDLRVSIMAYAAGSDAISIYPKRVSLARGISVRNYLVTARNIDLERVTVKALGNKSESGPGDRVDVFIIK